MLHVEGFLTAVRAMINAGHRLAQEHDTMTTPSMTVAREAYLVVRISQTKMRAAFFLSCASQGRCIQESSLRTVMKYVGW
jgi:hypothetical protein